MGNKNANFVSHKKSKLKVDGKPQLPLADTLVEGEIAINFAKDVETLSIKNESGDVVTFSSDNYYTEQKLGNGFTGANSAKTVTEVIDNIDLGNEVEINSGETPTEETIELWVDTSVNPITVEVYTKAETDSLLLTKVNTSDVVQTINSETSASTSAVSTSAVYGFVTSYTPSITVDQDFSNTASTNPISTKAVYSAVTDNELVWTNAFVTLSGVVSSHTENTEIHVTTADKEKLHTHNNKAALDSITGNVGTMAYQNTSSYSSATEVNTAFAGKANTATTYTKTEVDARDLWVSGTGTNSVAQKGGNNTASGDYSVAEGGYTVASGQSSHAEGYNTSATTNQAHAEGQSTKASGVNSHAEGNSTIANGYASHAEGYYTSATSYVSHAEGYYTITLNEYEHASGQYNVSASASTTFGNSGNTLFSVGNGTSTSARHNAFEIRQNGDIYITSGGTDILLQEFLGGTVDQVIDSGTSASTNAVSTSAVYEVIRDNEYVISQSLNDLESRKLDASAYTPTDLSNYYTKSETSGATEISNALGGKVNSATYTGHTADTTVHVTSSEKSTWNGKANASTTLAGYGITDAYTKTEINTMIGDIESILATI